VAAGGEALRKGERVRRRGDYLRAYRQGRRRGGALAVLHFFPNENEMPRLGVTVSRKVGNSVVRHRVKRSVVEAFRRAGIRRRLPAWDFVVHAKPEIARASFDEVRQELEDLLGAAVASRRVTK
jgi:ribonuclease P protein component